MVVWRRVKINSRLCEHTIEKKNCTITFTYTREWNRIICGWLFYFDLKLFFHLTSQRTVCHTSTLLLGKDDLVGRYDFSEICVQSASLAWWLVQKFLRASSRIFVWFMSKKIRVNFTELVIFPGKKIEQNWTYHITIAKTRLTILI